MWRISLFRHHFPNGFQKRFVGRYDEEKFFVSRVTDSTDLLSTWIVDSDSRADISRVVQTQHLDGPLLVQHRFDLFSTQESFVVETDDQIGCRTMSDQRVHRGQDFALGIEGILSSLAVDSLSSHAIDLGSIPSNQRFPYVVVAVIDVLIVRGIHIDEICGKLDGFDGR